jgi:hypothetical protein
VAKELSDTFAATAAREPPTEPSGPFRVLDQREPDSKVAEAVAAMLVCARRLEVSPYST